jgi:hypothetical protein
MSERELSKAMACVPADVYEAIFKEGYDAAKEESRAQLEAYRAAAKVYRTECKTLKTYAIWTSEDELNHVDAALRAAGIDLEERT